MTCRICNRPLPSNEEAAYRVICELCWAERAYRSGRINPNRLGGVTHAEIRGILSYDAEFGKRRAAHHGEAN